jgi:hypothetical protein
MRTETAEESNIFTSAKDILDNSFIGGQANLTEKSMNALGAILKLDQLQYSVITGKVLEPYAANEYLSAENFDTIAAKIKASFIDYVFQTKTDLVERLNELLVDPYTAVVTELAKARKAYPDMQILQQLTQAASTRVGGAKSVKLKANLKDAYDENIYTDMMRELRDNPATAALYNNLVDLAILQGTYQSAISIKNIIPIEDYAKKVEDAINSAASDLNLANFSKSGAFQRNNWKDENVFKKVTNIVPSLYNAQNSSTVANAGGAAQSSGYLGFTSNDRFVTTSTIFNPFLSQQTFNTFHNYGANYQLWGGTRHALTTSYTGLTLIVAAGTMTGIASIYGFNK